MPRAVLTFHSIDDTGSILSFPVAAFRRMMDRLASEGVAVLPFAELMKREHGVAITFDDGMRSVKDHALPVLRDHGFPAHLFLATGMMSGGRARWPTHGGAMAEYEMLNWDSVGECAANGIAIECHTVSHPDLRALEPARMLEECDRADEEIVRRLGRRPTLLAYPFGFHDDTVRSTLSPRYEGCFTTHLGYLRGAADRSRLPRLDTYYFQSPRRYERLFTATSRGYVALRSALRSLRGTQ